MSNLDPTFAAAGCADKLRVKIREEAIAERMWFNFIVLVKDRNLKNYLLQDRSRPEKWLLITNQWTLKSTEGWGLQIARFVWLMGV